MFILGDLNLYYLDGIEVDYNTEYDCEGSGCNEEGICRCGRICNAEMSNLNDKKIKNAIIEYILDNYLESNSILYKKNYSKKEEAINNFKKDSLIMEGIHQIVNSFDWANKYNYEVKVSGGYYGEELDGIFFLSMLDLRKKISIFLSLKTIQGREKFLQDMLNEVSDCKNQNKKQVKII